VQRQHEGAECLVMGDSIIWNVESDVRVQCFAGIRTEQLQRIMENRSREPCYHCNSSRY
jgi:hypothetical protein